eukprot:CAMPEP_0197939106 /NCGR_PEP_ID=MMETSP1439-20131203/119168_1 /TAXON_ID=66791 /ORGANISM="Gonyaulax spinifera, Strain CCMP409" /LENGTH=65 /DNA_ID=CAMNT_0043562211 /DNA_START=60 /DNA_END=253 /DNA_ORIENTATION=+
MGGPGTKGKGPPPGPGEVRAAPVVGQPLPSQRAGYPKGGGKGQAYGGPVGQAPMQGQKRKMPEGA